MADDHASRPPERPRSEPEIIPPGQAHGRESGPVWISYGREDGTQRIFVARPGPFSIIIALVIVGVMLAAVVLILAGLVLFWIPVVVLVIAAFVLAGYLRYYWARLKRWAGRH